MIQDMNPNKKKRDLKKKLIRQEIYIILLVHIRKCGSLSTSAAVGVTSLFFLGQYYCSVGRKVTSCFSLCVKCLGVQDNISPNTPLFLRDRKHCSYLRRNLENRNFLVQALLHFFKTRYMSFFALP